MNALPKLSQVAFAALLTSTLLSSCAHTSKKPTGSADSTATGAAEHAPAATSTVTASGTVPLTYQWRVDGTKIPGVTNGPAPTNK